MVIRKLQAADYRVSFRSGDIAHDEFLQKYAEHPFTGTTYVGVQGKRVLGFATLSPAELVLPERTLPVLRLSRLAVDRSVRGQGVGGALLKFAIGLVTDTGREGLCVDAQTAFFERFGFVPLELQSGFSPLRPAPRTLFLAAATIRQAMPT